MNESRPGEDFPSHNLNKVVRLLEAGEEYPEEDIIAACNYVDGRWDCSDFRLVSLLRIVYVNNYDLTGSILLMLRWKDKPMK